jgi:hypothetical protein
MSMFRHSGIEILVILGVGPVSVLLIALVLLQLRSRGVPEITGGSFGHPFDLMAGYVSRYLFASVLISPLLGMAIGKPVLIILLPVLHFFAAIPIIPGAWLIMFAGNLWLKRTWTRARAWVAAVLSVTAMWLLSILMVTSLDRPPEMLVRLLGEGPATIAQVVSVPMTASAVSLAIAWLVPGGCLLRTLRREKSGQVRRIE